jgi:cytochrome P450
MFVRVAIQDDLLPSGVRVPAGSKIYLCQYTAHRNEQFFPDPERFDPERFHPRVRHTRPRFSYFPFGGGGRVCVAESLARLEGVLVLASLARRFDLELPPGQVIEPRGAITLRPKNPIRATARPFPAG